MKNCEDCKKTTGGFCYKHSKGEMEGGIVSKISIPQKLSIKEGKVIGLPSEYEYNIQIEEVKEKVNEIIDYLLNS
jgi:hypothetical protein